MALALSYLVHYVSLPVLILTTSMVLLQQTESNKEGTFHVMALEKLFMQLRPNYTFIINQRKAFTFMVNQIKRGIIEVIKELMALVEMELGGKRVTETKNVEKKLKKRI